MTTPDNGAIPADPNDPAWAEARRTFIGASDAPAVLGLSPWRTPLDVWAEKVGLTTGNPPTLATRLGHELEDLIARIWHEQHPDADVRHAQVTVRHPDLPWLAASTDREVGLDGLLECKLVGGRQTDRWDDGVPHYVAVQAQIQLCVTGRRWVDVCSLHAGHGWDHRIARIERDDQALAAMLPRLDRFWTDHVVTGIRPELDGDPDQIRRTMTDIWPADPDAKPVILRDADMALIDDLKRSKALLRDLERNVKAAENELIAVLGTATDAWAPNADDKPAATYRPATRIGHDLKRITAGDVDGFTADELDAARRVLAAVATTSTYRTLRLR
jgi:putative phage-type endonuclease